MFTKTNLNLDPNGTVAKLKESATELAKISGADKQRLLLGMLMPVIETDWDTKDANSLLYWHNLAKDKKVLPVIWLYAEDSHRNSLKVFDSWLNINLERRRWPGAEQWQNWLNGLWNTFNRTAYETYAKNQLEKIGRLLTCLQCCNTPSISNAMSVPAAKRTTVDQQIARQVRKVI
ncbi:MAG: hypothetical protein K2X81_26360, partial [Candidatus Obscuribacterales bacterium]|nr:hypothetical protein [Candidatus Obscuribacterales bacterium]